MTENVNHLLCFFVATVLNSHTEQNLTKIRRHPFSYQASSDLALPFQVYFVG